MDLNNLSEADAQALLDSMKQMLLVLSIGGFLILLIHVAIAWMLDQCLAAIPEKFHRLPRWYVWMTIVPCLNIVWHFLVYPRLGQTFRLFFEARGHSEFGDCGEKKGMHFSIGYVIANAVPLLGIIAAFWALIVQLQYINLVWKLRKEALALPRD